MGKEGEGIGDLTLLEVMARLPDPRSGHGRRHPLGAILGLAVCAMLCGCRSLYAISQWGRDQGLDVSQALGFTRERTPCGPHCIGCSAGWTGRPSNCCWDNDWGSADWRLSTSFWPGWTCKTGWSRETPSSPGGKYAGVS